VNIVDGKIDKAQAMAGKNAEDFALAPRDRAR
jgi:hypothetical protein